MAKFQKRNLPLAMAGTPKTLPKSIPVPGRGNMIPMPKPRPRRAPVMKQKGVALSKFGPAKVPAKKVKQTKMPMF